MRMAFQVSQIVHRAKIIVDENGTEAVALAGGKGLGAGAKRIPKLKSIADHPSLFVIRHIERDMPLFRGRVSKL